MDLNQGRVLTDSVFATESLLVSAERFITQFYAETGAGPGAGDQRLSQVRDEIELTGTYWHTPEELEFGARVAWRNSARCIGRLYWRSLQVRDRRDVCDASQVAAESIDHLRQATNGGKVRPMITVFAPDAPGRPGPRILNGQLVRYAGYPGVPDDAGAAAQVLGDPANADVTALALALGWPGRQPASRFDVLPLLVQEAGGAVSLHEIPADAVLEVPIEHPEFDWFAGLGLRWHAVPVISNMYLEIGGICYPAAPFNGWYMGTEIGSRNFGDTGRYNQLPVIAGHMGLSTSSDRNLWKDKAITELNLAVLHSYTAAGVTITDHHTESGRFLAHLEKEERSGRACPADWTWIVPPAASSATPVFHRYYQNFDQSPNFYYHHVPAMLRSDLGCKETIKAAATEPSCPVEHADATVPRKQPRPGRDRAMTVRDIATRAFLPTRKRQEQHQPGSAGERILQDRLGTTDRANRFYQNQVTGELTPAMRQFIGRMSMAFIATSDDEGECDCSFRSGPAGFIRVLDDHTIAYAEYKGNGVMASLGNMLLNPHIGIIMIDFTHDLIGLHINGDASIVTPAQIREFDLDLPEDENAGRKAVEWVLINVTEAYVHCTKRIPKLIPASRTGHWGSENPRQKGNDYFGVQASRVVPAGNGVAATNGTTMQPAPLPAGTPPHPTPANGNGHHPAPATAAHPAPANGAQPVPANSAQPVPANGAQPAPANSHHAMPANGAQPVPANGAQPVPANGAQPAPANSHHPTPATGAQPAPANSHHPTPATGAQPAPANSHHPTPANSAPPAPANSHHPTPANSAPPAPASDNPFLAGALLAAPTYDPPAGQASGHHPAPANGAQPPDQGISQRSVPVWQPGTPVASRTPRPNRNSCPENHLGLF